MLKIYEFIFKNQSYCFKTLKYIFNSQKKPVWIKTKDKIAKKIVINRNMRST